MERSLKEAVSELSARVEGGLDRRVILTGLKGAATPLFLAEAALSLRRPFIVVVPLAKEAESLAAEASFFLARNLDDEPLRRGLHIYPGWQVAPLERLSPLLDNQSAGFVALYALRRLAAPLVVTSIEALMTRINPRASFDASVLKLTAGDGIDLEGLVQGLVAIGYQRLPQTEEPGDFSVRGGIIDLFSPLYNLPLRLELEDDILASIRFFDPADQRSLGEINEAIAIAARLVAPTAIKDRRLRDQVERRAAEIDLVRKEVGELTETLETGLLFPGVENLLPYMHEEPLGTLFDYLPEGALLWLVEPGRLLAQATSFAEQVAQAADNNQAHHSFFPRPDSLYLEVAELQERLARWPAV